MSTGFAGDGIYLLHVTARNVDWVSSTFQALTLDTGRELSNRLALPITKARKTSSLHLLSTKMNHGYDDEDGPLPPVVSFI